MSSKVTVKVNINGIVYPVSCEAGEENRLIKSSNEVNNIIHELSSVSAGVSESRLLAMTSLVLADKLIEKEDFIKKDLRSDVKDENLQHMNEFIIWLSKATERMNKVAKLLENK
jgi:cell division protein ZapA (FtsZ GTPase activity inhibitor)